MAEDSYFVELEIETDAETLADEAVERLQDRWDGWEPNDGDLEVVMIETVAPMAEDVAEEAAQVPPAIFREYGQKLIGREYDEGQVSSGAVTFTLIDSDGHTIPADTEIDIDGYAFTVLADVLVPPGDSSVAGVQVVASDPMVDTNDLSGDSVNLISGLAFIEDVSLDDPTSGGSDPETDEDYQSGLSQELLLQAKTLVTTRDYELWALSSKHPSIGRVTAEHEGDREVNVTVATAAGEVISAPNKAALAADYAEYHLVNTVVNIGDPDYTVISITYTAHALPGFDHTDLETRIDAMLAELLSPANYGKPKSGDPGVATQWVDDPLVRQFFIVDRIGDVEGVAYVESVSISGDVGSASGVNWLMDGEHPLPQPGTMTGTIT